MTEATWGDQSNASEIDWRMSAALENVPRGEEDVAEVTSLLGAVHEWIGLDPKHKAGATLTLERPVLIDGTARTSFQGEAIAMLAAALPAKATPSPV
ncbi:hypothetical protein H5J25_04465 [Sphingomonas aliaeris]|uniref:Uncharacterized protein n=1 Tax=Sphingomonas aliaeris TaxID=2759526 RepID=A0A974NW48_9SPHN|nr:hypothetical protein [Sphingomonas aliaeris]QQV78001.1 hypothetical protein H5J25_04465 [Sphingomonas aliaeris]